MDEERRKTWSEKKLNIIRILLDDEGHSGSDITNKLRKNAQSELDTPLNDLMDDEIIHQGHQTISTKPISEYKHRIRNYDKHPKNPVIPYFINKDIKILEKILHEMTEETENPITAYERRMYVLNSKYAENVKKSFKEEVDKIIEVEKVFFREHIVKNRFGDKFPDIWKKSSKSKAKPKAEHKTCSKDTKLS